ncbi:MAG: hypothetical protein KC482_03585 [Dehalococcoidia bacterium]|nr:hypothetical protein [Dehalococcoidia bacterium]
MPERVEFVYQVETGIRLNALAERCNWFGSSGWRVVAVLPKDGTSYTIVVEQEKVSR